MNILFVGTDRQLFVEGSTTYKRHRGLGASHFENSFTSIVFSTRSHGINGPVQVADNVTAHPTNSASRLLYGLDALKVARNLPRPDVVSAQDPFETGLVALMIARHFKIPLVVEVHTDFLSKGYRTHSLVNWMRLRIASFVLPRAAAGYAVSASLRDRIVTRYHLTSPFEVLPIYVDVSRFSSLVRTQHEGVSLLWAGRLEKEKNPLLALDALAAARRAGIDAKLTVVGTGSLWEALRRKARSLHLSPYLVEVEAWENLAPYYAAADVLLVTSAYEGYGMVIVEALAARTPVFSNDVGIAREAGAHIAYGDYASSFVIWLKEGKKEGKLLLAGYAAESEYLSKIGVFYASATKLRLLIICEAVDLEHPILGFFHDWIKQIAGNFSQTSVLCLQKGRYVLPENVQVYSLGKEKKRSRLMYLIRFYSYIWKLRHSYDAVHVHMNQEYIVLGGVFWRLLGKRIALWRNFHSGDLGTHISAAFADIVFYTSASSYTARFRNSMRMPVGVDTETFFPAGTPLPMSLLFVGRIAPVKRVEVLLEAVAHLANKGMQVSCDIVGDALPKDKKYLDALKERRIEGVTFCRGIANRDIVALYRSHEVCVNMSPSGMYDKTIIEAAASGCFSVAVSADWKQETGGMLSFDGTAADLARVLEEVLSLSEEEKEQLRVLGRTAANRQSLAALLSALPQAIMGRTTI